MSHRRSKIVSILVIYLKTDHAFTDESEDGMGKNHSHQDLQGVFIVLTKEEIC